MENSPKRRSYEVPVFNSPLPPMRASMRTVRHDLQEYARNHTGPSSWSASVEELAWYPGSLR